MAGSITVSSITLDSDNNFSIKSNTGATILSANGTGLITGIASGSAITNAQLTTPTVSGNLSLDSTGTSGVRLPAANTLSFHTSGTEDVRIDSTGNLFLGKTSDSDAAQGLSLYPAGSISYNDNNSGTRTPISFRRSGTQVGSVRTTTTSSAYYTTSSDTTGAVLTNAGIAFPPTQVASADANTLDDYEEGTWTPAAGSDNGALTATYGFRTGRYVKIGNRVWATFDLELSSRTLTGSVATLFGLPFSVASNGDLSGSFGNFAIISATGTNFNYITIYAQNAASFCYIPITTGSASGTSLASNSFLGSTTRVAGGVMYNTTS